MTDKKDDSKDGPIPLEDFEALENLNHDKTVIVESNRSEFFIALTQVQEKYGITVVDYVDSFADKDSKHLISFVARGISKNLNNLGVFSVVMDNRTFVDKATLERYYPKDRVVRRIVRAIQMENKRLREALKGKGDK